MIVKITTSANTFDLIDRVKRCSFRREAGSAIAVIEHDGGVSENHAVCGSVYVLNDAGKTVDSFHK